MNSISPFYLSLAAVIVLVAICLTFIVRAFFLKIQIPWHLLIVPVAVILTNAGMTINGVHVGLIWFFLLWLILIKKKETGDYFLQKRFIIKSLALGIFTGLIFNLAYFILETNHLVTKEPLPVMTTLFFISRSLEVGFGEELLFRSFFLGEFRKQGLSDSKSILLQGLLFSICHFSRYNTPNQWPALLLVTIFGLWAGYITVKYKNISGPIVAHILVTIVTV